MPLTAVPAGLDFKVIVPVGTAPLENLPDARCAIRDKEQRTPAFVLFNMNALVRPDGFEFFIGDGEDDMAKDNSSDGQLQRKLPATCLSIPIGDFQRPS